jgi:3-phosphoshikimate 1-carboxyvinyltransferase
MVALSPMAEITLHELGEESLQGDSVARHIFSELGVETNFINSGCRLKNSQIQIETFAWDFSDCPDLAQTIITTCAAMGIPSSFSGLTTLAVKETDRVAALKQELGKINITIKGSGAGTVVLLPANSAQPSKVSFSTYNDHRMAMALSALCMKNSVTLEDPGVVAKSYPNFWKELKRAGIAIKSV